MSWQTVAAKDVRDAGRSKTIWLVVGVLGLLFLVLIGADFLTGSDLFNDFTDFVTTIVSFLGFLVPLIALLLGYKSVIHERVSGSIVLSLSFPHSRRDLIAGTFVGRGIVLLAPVLGTLVVVGLLGAFLYPPSGSELLGFGWLVLITALFGLGFLAVAIALSMSTTAERRVTLGTFGAYILLVSFWDNLVTATVQFLYRFRQDALFTLPDWVYLMYLLKPAEAYNRLLRVGFDTTRGARYASSEAPWFVDWWMALVVFAAWIVVPLTVGLYRFERTDL
ncbi:ABC transporter permease [Natrialbaceae archaeon A-chndr2]